MKHLFQILLALCALFVFSVAVHAEEQQESVEQAIAQDNTQFEQAWEARTEDDSVCFSFTLIDCGEAAVCRTEHSALELSYRFAQTDWSRFSVFYSEDLQCGGTTPVYDPLGENAMLRVRCFLYWQDGALTLCQCCEITTQTGVLICRSANTRAVSADQRSFSMRFESFPAETPPVEASVLIAEKAAQNGDAAAPVTEKRCWTYLSSDDRPLWQVELSGSFLAGFCGSADGRVTILDDTWTCEQAEFYPDGICAVALITLRRYTLGIPVATQIYEFRLPPPN